MNVWRLPVLSFILVLLIFPGCRSAKWHLKKADKAAGSIITQYQKEALGRTEKFTIERPSDSLRKRLMIEQNLPGYGGAASSNKLSGAGQVLRIKMLDALQIGARNNRIYQSRKEDVFQTALNLDLSRAEFRNSYSGLLAAMFSDDEGGESASRSVGGEASAGVTRKLQTGMSLTGKLGVDLVKLLTMDKTSTFGILADATISIPLLRGAGRDIVRESLTQAERNLIYAMWSFERFKRSFAVRIAGEYFGALEQAKQIQNAEANLKSLTDARQRMQELAKAGRQPETQVDQARQDELRANSRLIAAKQRYEDALDSLKMSLGIPVDARIDLDKDELTRLSESTAVIFAGAFVKAEDGSRKTEEAVLKALNNRLDLRTSYWALEDARRKLNMARDALDAEMQLKLSASTREANTSGSSEKKTDAKFGDGKYGAVLDVGLPWDRTAERVAFRKSMIDLEAAARQVEEQEDGIKQEIRSAVRKLIEIEETYRIQKQAVELAERRVNSTEIFLQAGRSQIRDVLEAQEDLVSAQDALVSAIVSYRMASLGLRRDLELLEINEEGIWSSHE